MPPTDWSAIVNDESIKFDLTDQSADEIAAALAPLEDNDISELADQLGVRVAAANRRKAVASVLIAALRIGQRLIGLPPTA